ncbi:MAG: hypothetical protein GY842_15680 [bacterium]|nr:hypothetical protein [bacterium]
MVAGVLICGLTGTQVRAAPPSSKHDQTASPTVQSFSAFGTVSSTSEPSESLRSLMDVPADPPFGSIIALEPMDLEELRREDRSDPPPHRAPRIGVGRSLEINGAEGVWSVLPDGRYVWTLAIVSEQAVALRLQVSECAIPPGGELRIAAGADPGRVDGPYVARGPFRHGGFWSAVLTGDTAYVEYCAPLHAVPPIVLPFVLDGLQHIYRSPLETLPPQREGDCHNDVMCATEWVDLASATAGLTFVGEEDSLACTGVLLNSISGDLTPYLVTAGHCVENQLAAESMIFYWKYQTDYCDGNVPNLLSVPSSVGADLLASSEYPHWDEDYALLMVRGELPPGSYTWSGWDTTTIADGTNCASIHHPDSAFKRISYAQKDTASSTGFIRMNWYDGATEDGSSGAGAYLEASQLLVGLLVGGPSSCLDLAYDDYYAFRYLYPKITSWIQAGSDDIFEDNDSCNDAAEVAASFYPDLVVKYADDDWYLVRSSTCGPVEIRLDFVDAFGDINVELYADCGGPPIDGSTGQGDTESILLPAGPSDDYYVRVFLQSDVRNTYDMSITDVPGGTLVYPIPAGVSIPDENPTGVDQVFVVPDHFVTSGLKVGLHLTHTWNGDLKVTLSHDGTTITLLDRPGAPSRAVGYNNDGFDIILDDAAFVAIEDYDSGGPMVVGTFSPDDSLAAFDGEDIHGTWTLNVADLERLDEGTIDSWTLYAPPAEICECAGDGDFNTDGRTDFADFAFFQACFTGGSLGAPPAGCQPLNFDCDRDVDLDDFAVFASHFNGPVPSSPSKPPDKPNGSDSKTHTRGEDGFSNSGLGQEASFAAD